MKSSFTVEYETNSPSATPASCANAYSTHDQDLESQQSIVLVHGDTQIQVITHLHTYLVNAKTTEVQNANVVWCLQ